MPTKIFIPMILKDCCNKLLFLIVALSLCSCQYFEKVKVKRIVNHTYGRQIDDSWTGVQIFEDTIIPVTNIVEKPITVITCEEDNICPECLGKYLRGAESLVNFFDTDSVQFIEIIESQRYDDIQINIKGIDPNKVKVICDVNKNFLTRNSLKNIPNRHLGILIDNKHRIILLGNPLRSNEVSELYRNTIRQMIGHGGTTQLK